MRVIGLQLKNGGQLYARRQQEVQEKKRSETIWGRFAERKGPEAMNEPPAAWLAVRSELCDINMSRTIKRCFVEFVSPFSPIYFP